ncbi:hypothetical protein ROD_24341 [Citrobacter rodentium ICC168]|uniref:Uncharacterized protein n=1 Tax=Citrobacter rodentium (strain ICC168) TaxID=637910 RepID=D2TTC0_CITRI|nr:hypothetical protein ROD_24341 [Citrobacter rodentium ICC168]
MTDAGQYRSRSASKGSVTVKTAAEYPAQMTFQFPESAIKSEVFFVTFGYNSGSQSRY